MNVREFNKVVIESDFLDEVVTKGQEYFCEAYASDDCDLMSYLLSEGIGINNKVKEIFIEMFKKEDYNLYYLLSSKNIKSNKDYKGDNILKILLSYISNTVYIIEQESYDELILIDILNNLDYEDLKDSTIFNILKNPTVSRYLNVLKDRYIDLSKICLLELDSRSGDDCFLNDFANELSKKYDLVPIEILTRSECVSIYSSLISNNITLAIATLYPDEFVCGFNSDNSLDVGFTEDEINNLRNRGVRLISLKTDILYDKFFD